MINAALSMGELQGLVHIVVRCPLFSYCMGMWSSFNIACMDVATGMFMGGSLRLAPMIMNDSINQLSEHLLITFLCCNFKTPRLMALISHYYDGM